ncbi:MAG: hypothetical protein IJB63_07805 [Alistipes sp.]|nr:hypothetical protein [Alistipes sp.]
MSNKLIGNQNNCLDAQSAYDNVLKRYNRIVKYFNERYEVGAFYFMDYEHKEFIVNKFLGVLNSSSRLIYQRLPRPGMSETWNYDFYFGQVDSENLWHGSGVYSWEWEEDNDGDTIIVYYVGEFCHGELTRNGVWCIFSREDGKLRLEIEGVISVGALGDPSRYCYYAGRRDIRRSSQKLEKIKEEQKRKEQLQIIADQKRREQQRIREEQERIKQLEWERGSEERKKQEAEKKARYEEELKAKRKYINENFWSLKLRSLIAPISLIIVTYIMFLSEMSIINKWEIMPWWGCILYILGIPVGVIITTYLGTVIPIVCSDDFIEDTLMSEELLASLTFLPMVWTGYFAYQAVVNDKSIWWIILCIVVFIFLSLARIYGGLIYDVCFTDSNGNMDKTETRKALFLELILIVGISLLVFILC